MDRQMLEEAYTIASVCLDTILTFCHLVLILCWQKEVFEIRTELKRLLKENDHLRGTNQELGYPTHACLCFPLLDPHDTCSVLTTQFEATAMAFIEKREAEEAGKTSMTSEEVRAKEKQIEVCV